MDSGSRKTSDDESQALSGASELQLIEDQNKVYEEGMIKKWEERTKLVEVIQQLLDYLHKTHKSQFKKATRVLGTTSTSVPSRFHPSDLVLACGLDDGQVIFFETKNPLVPFSNWREKKEKFLRQGRERITALEWNVTGTQLAAGLRDGSVIVWSYPSGRVLFEEKKHPYKVDLIAWNPFSQDILATRDREEVWELLFWNTQENGDVGKANPFLTVKRQLPIWNVAWISANQIAIGLNSDEIEICEIDDDKGTRVKRFRHRENCMMVSTITGLQWNERTKYLASSSLDGSIKIWSMDSDRPVHTFHAHSDCCSLAWRRNVQTENDGEIDVQRVDKENFNFACGLWSGSIAICNPLEEDETKRKRVLPQKHSIRADSVSFSPDGRFLASADYGGELIIWSSETWLPVFTGQNNRSDLSWMSTDSSSVQGYKLAVRSKNKVCVVEQSFTE